MPTRKDLANAIRALSMDAVQQANSGHPGMPMGMADMAEVLFNDFLVHNPHNPAWPNRDRFILSNGHGAMLHYSLLYLSGYDLSIEDIKNFRQLHSKTPGHPEYRDTPGVETTTGPLGQGLANGVGMAIAEKALAQQFNRDEHNIVDHYTYVFAGDGCLMEGVSHEACSLAGTLGLGKLIVLYDDNGISIDGKVDSWFSDDTPKRFEAYDWQVIAAVDGHDPKAINAALEQARAESNKPTLICCRTQIGFGSPNLAGTHKVHGAPLGDDEIAATRDNIGWHHESFVVPDDILAQWNALEQGAQQESDWQQRFERYQQNHPELAAEFKRRTHSELPADWQQVADAYINQCQQNAQDKATRKASLDCLNAFGPTLPELLGGSADLTGSNLTWWDGSDAMRQDHAHANYIHYGVREFGMFAIMNGISNHSGFIPYGGTFLTFVDYGRNALRLAAMMQTKSICVLSHDSIGLGEDGPTHQPVEHAAMLRITPGLNVWRPCDAVETAASWKSAIEFNGPTALLLTRQTVAHQERSNEAVANIARGGYVLRDCDGTPDAIIIATGSEVEIAEQAWQQLTRENQKVRLVSMPCADIFKTQSESYRESVLPGAVQQRVAIEAGVTDYWYQFANTVIGIDRFGLSAPYKEVYEELGITKDAVITAVKKVLTDDQAAVTA